MGRAIAAHQPGAIQREHHRQILQGDVVNELIVGALQERRVDRDDRLEALAGETRRERHRVLFGDRHVEIAVRESLRVFDQPEPSRIAGVMPMIFGSRSAMSHSHWPKICEYDGPELASLNILPLAGSNGPGPCHLIGSASAGA